MHKLHDCSSFSHVIKSASLPRPNYSLSVLREFITILHCSSASTLGLSIVCCTVNVGYRLGNIKAILINPINHIITICYYVKKMKKKSIVLAYQLILLHIEISFKILHQIPSKTIPVEQPFFRQNSHIKYSLHLSYAALINTTHR